MAKKTLEKSDWIFNAAALILLAALLIVLRDYLSPLVLFAVAFIFLFNFRNAPRARAFFVLFLLLFLFWFLYVSRTILFPFVLSFVLAYIFDPLVDALEKVKLPRVVAILIIILFLLGIFALILVFLIPVLVSQVGELLDQTINYAPKIKQWFETDVLNFLAQFNIDVEKLKQVLAQELPGRLQTILQTFFRGVLNITVGVGAVISQILNLVLIPVLTFYFLKDFDAIVKKIGSFVPKERQATVREYAKQIDTAVSGFLRGQLTVCLIVAILTTVGLFILKIKYALILGLTAGLLNIVPYVGLLVSLGLALIVGLFSPAPLLSCLKILAVFGVVQSLEGSVISPKIVGESVGLHPAWVIFAILVFAQFFGFVGLLIAVPIAAVIKILLVNWYRPKPVPAKKAQTVADRK